MKSFRIILSALMALALLGCASGGAPQDPQQSIYALQSGYRTALTVAVAYKQLPPCGMATSPLLCSSPKVVAQVQQADDVAYQAIKAAETTVRTPGAGANAQTALVAAQQALAALTSITATLQVKQ
jgi:hypothetical protein